MRLFRVTYRNFKWLKFIESLENKGVKYVKSKVVSFNELVYADKDSNYDYIINCTGLGARELCGDLNMHPVRGLVLRVNYTRNIIW